LAEGVLDNMQVKVILSGLTNIFSSIVPWKTFIRRDLSKNLLPKALI